jgi:hypothetical protein
MQKIQRIITGGEHDRIEAATSKQPEIRIGVS